MGLAWVRKYRPASFSEYLGDNVKNLVMNRLKDRNNIPQTIMLYGTRGTGKTSMARLMSKEIQCQEPIDGHSCGKCDSCLAIDEYIRAAEADTECDGIIEVDAAKTNGKDAIDEIIENALIRPMYPMQYKILILDECHMMSKAAQNSMLKVIEEPPPWVIFILCTTDPEKVLQTIHSRMQLKVEVQRKTVEEMANRLLEICEKENVRTSMEALRIIAKKGDRVPRECINILENVATNYGFDVTVDNVREAVRDVGSEVYVEYIKAANTSLEDILAFISKLKDNNIGAKEFISGLIRFILDACFVRYGMRLDDYSVDFVKQAKELFKLFNSSEFDMAFQIMNEASNSVQDNDDNKNELTLLLTALRIGKIGLLAKGLDSEQVQAEKENRKSIQNYTALVGHDAEERFSKIESFDSPTQEAFASVFSNMSDVANSSGILSLSEDVANDESDTNNSSKEFASKQYLMSLLGDV